MSYSSLYNFYFSSSILWQAILIINQLWIGSLFCLTYLEKFSHIYFCHTNCRACHKSLIRYRLALNHQTLIASNIVGNDKTECFMAMLQFAEFPAVTSSFDGELTLYIFLTDTFLCFQMKTHVGFSLTETKCRWKRVLFHRLQLQIAANIASIW